MRLEVGAERVSAGNGLAVDRGGAFVLYLMTAHRRLHHNFALQRAVDLAVDLDRPLVVLEALRCAYPWASDRLHRFVLDGMQEHQRAMLASKAFYYAYVEPEPGAGRGLVDALMRRAAAVVSDDYPCFFLPRVVAAVAERCPVRFETVDSNGLLPMRLPGRDFPTAYAFRRYLQANLPAHLGSPPQADPLARRALRAFAGDLGGITRRWQPAGDALLGGEMAALAGLPIDHDVPVVEVRGGERRARAALRAFLAGRLAHYDEARNDPGVDGASGLSPWLHFGHLSAHEVFAAIAEAEGWSPDRLAARATGSRTGWWGMSPAAEAFLDQLVTWRELGFNFAAHRDDLDRYESLPAWARATLARHQGDRRPYVYSLADFEAARTHDPLWNAAQNQLRRQGTIHNYLRMLWGKKIVEWSASPPEALATMIELNNKYALDGRDPNSYTGIFWVLGRYDRPWGPERPVFGTVRYMSSENTARKLDVKGYLARWATG